MDVYINGIGIVSRCACAKEELESLISGQIPEPMALPLNFSIEIPPSKLRRNSRYNKMACAAADQALKDSGVPQRLEEGSLDCHRVGTIISTGYGAAEYYSSFADAVVKGDPNRCSPSVFSGSVPNSCVGQICILNNLKGFSTVLAGGDPLEYASLLIQTGRAEDILTGSVEEYFPPLYDAFQTIDAAKGADLSEGAAMAVLSASKTGESYCRVAKSAGMNFGYSPFLHCPSEPEAAVNRIAEVLEQFPKPDVFLAAANGTWLDEAEQQALQRVFGDVSVRKPKTVFGETLGCGYMMNVLSGAFEIRTAGFRSVLAAGADLTGNYFCTLLEQI